MQKSSRVVVYCTDLSFTTAIRTTGKEKGLQVTVRRTFDPMLDFEETGVKIYVVDLMVKGVDIPEMLQTIKSVDSEATLVCFAPHVETEALEMATEAGADLVLARGDFLAQLGGILEKAK